MSRRMGALVLASMLWACGGGERISSSTNPAGAGGGSMAGGIGGTFGGSGGSIGGSGAEPAGAGGAGGAGAAGAAGGDTGPCQGSTQAFVRRAIEATLGRKPYGQAEVQLYLDLIAGVDALEKGASGIGTLSPGRRAAVVAMMGREEFLFRWIDAYRDFLRVQRTEDQANPGCYGTTLRGEGTAVAELVRDQPPDMVEGDGQGPFTLRDVILASLKLDDVSPVYVANLFAMLKLTYPGANAAPDKLELARRNDFGAWFDGVYLRRDPVCLTCHNTEFSVTFSDEPELNRHFPVPVLLERALFGASSGPSPDETHDGPTRMHAPLRFDGFVDAGQARPWGWSEACGRFAPKDQIPPDIAKVNALFGNLKGDKTSPWDLATSLQEGFRKLRLQGLSQKPDGTVEDTDEAFAYLVVLNIVEQVWREVLGTPLTIANYYPRNATARDQLALLAEGFVASGFSHRELLLQILASPYFNLAPPEDDCWSNDYPLPPIFDPWTTAEQDPKRRGNSVADALVPRSSRVTMLAAYRALSWPNPPQTAFPDRYGPEGEFQASVGVFLKNAEPGFRGLDFQGRLGWESRFGSCARLASNPNPDLIDDLLATAKNHPEATVRDLVVALKDRITGEGFVEDPGEQEALEAILGYPLSTLASSLENLDAPLRRVCGVLLASPQFLLHGAIPPDQLTIPILTPPSTSYSTLCQQLGEVGLPGGLQVSCAGGSLQVTSSGGTGGQGGAGGSNGGFPQAGSGNGDGGAAGGPSATCEPGTCEHDTCTAGAKLAKGCSACVDAVCVVDAYCCDNDWDQQCINEAVQFCACDCGGTGGSGGAGPGLEPACDVPIPAPSGGACVAVGGDIACNPVSGEACTNPGHACDYGEKGFACYGPPNDRKLCESCDYEKNQFCENGMTCIGGVCLRFCCEDTDCGEGGVCSKQGGAVGLCYKEAAGR
ncbi:MAG: hypothetical protein RMJ98_18065 [Myxococcales bacterium]|nr:hypothetical protein [Polyangiaceae bacterium]MDW8251204.1 hypothetical protein [Myxococcales bacterium]